MEVRVGPAAVTIHSDTEFAVSDINGEMSSTSEQGYFASDTRLVSGYRLKLCRVRPTLRTPRRWRPIPLASSSPTRSCSATTEPRSPRVLASASRSHHRSRCPRGLRPDELQPPTCGGESRGEHRIRLRRPLRRQGRPDRFDGVRCRARGTSTGRLVTRYHNGDFERAIAFKWRSRFVARVRERRDHVPANSSPVESWHTCLLWRPILDGGEPEHPPRACQIWSATPIAIASNEHGSPQTTRFTTSDPE